MGSFANADPTIFVGGRFDETGGERVLVVPAGIGAALEWRGRIGGSPLDGHGSFVRARPALATLARNGWFEVEQTVGEMRIRLGERALSLSRNP